MKYKIAGVRVKQMPSKYKPGTFWNIAEVKLEGQGDTKFELQGYGARMIENLKEGQLIGGYFGEKEWNGNITRTLNHYTTDYLAEIMEKAGLMGGATTTAGVDPQPSPEEGPDDNW